MDIRAAQQRGVVYQGHGMADKLYNDFEKLFTDTDGMALELNQLAGTDVNHVLLDCLM